ncbi:hypothetical protein WJX72_008860 [[Myrmecia] bisecta]|uniref:Acetyl-CoA carboxylase n=1 Tax=[Myrmecia] bisecta TaxID=41462 RepID=A0AAW1PB36_9CHLO
MPSALTVSLQADATTGGAPSTSPNGSPQEGVSKQLTKVKKTLGGMRSASFGELTSNPLKMGIPKRVPSLTCQVENVIRDLGGDKAIHSVLIANNGIAAVKFIRSVRLWAYNTFGHERAVSLVALATPEDIRVNAEHITIADQLMEVPGGSNNNNYANVRLIVQMAERANVDAVWPGWGHASEKPELPKALSETPQGIRFLGPPAAAMAALGDKIGSTILAQAAAVPTLPWSGTGVALSYAECNGQIPPEVYDKACIHTLPQALACCARIGYPVMLKASWGGGGKGIRKVASDEDVRACFKQVQGEVPGSPIFAMKLAPPSRHLEVQLLCDSFGNAVSLFSRDCSVQRRHQKIVEEGPVSKASQETLRAMEKCARALARSVRYVGAATVEFLYCLETNQYYFLELNPRLQVEHPVTEMISGVNIPACQMLVGMNVPLHRIPDIRRLYGKDPQGRDEIDFEADPQIKPHGHVVAVRITSEDADDGFKPTCGAIDELSFKSTPDVWGYFSVKGGGGIHEFSDSQFGHLFAKGATRDAAIRAMVVALKEVKIRGEIRTIVDYAIDMIQSPDFTGNNHSTSWLDQRIAAHVKAEKPAWHLGVISGAILRAMALVNERSAEYLGYLEKGQLPPARLTLTSFDLSFVIEGSKYSVKVSRRGPQAFRLSLGPSQVDVVARKLNDGGLLVQVDGQAHVVHSEEEAIGTRLTIDSLTCLLAAEHDPSRLFASSPGKLMRYLVADGAHVEAEQPYAEVEVMKMIMPLLTTAPGRLNFQLPEGSILLPGDLIARLDLDDPEAVTRAEPFAGGFPDLGPPLVFSQGVDHRFKEALNAAKMIMAGYEHPEAAVVSRLLACLDDPALSLIQWTEVFAVVQNRMPTELAGQLDEIVADYEEELEQCEMSGLMQPEPQPSLQFPARQVLAAIQAAIQAAAPADRSALSTTVEPLVKVAVAHAEGKEAYARSLALELFEDYLAVEERFQLSGVGTEQEIIDALRQVHSEELLKVVGIVVSHQGLRLKSALILELMNAVVLAAPEHYRTVLRRLAGLVGKGSSEVAARAQQLLEFSLLSELRAVVARALSGQQMFSGAQLAELLNSDTLASDSPTALLHAEPEVPAAAAPAHRDVVRRPTIIEGLYSGLGGSGAAHCSPNQLEANIWLLVEAPAAVEDALASILDTPEPNLQQRALLTYIKRIYYPFTTRDPTLQTVDGTLCALWAHAPPAVLSAQAATECLSTAVVISALAELPAAVEAALSAVKQSGLKGLPCATFHVMLVAEGEAALKLTGEAEKLHKEAAAAADGFASREADATASASDPRAVTAAVVAQVGAVAAQLAQAGYDSVSVLSKRGRSAPLRTGFWRSADKPLSYSPDVLLRSVEPIGAQLLELRKLSGLGGRLTHRASRNRQCHSYVVMERPNPRSLALKRVFLRGVLRQLCRPDFIIASVRKDAGAIVAAAMQEVEQLLVDTLSELDRVALNGHEREAVPADWAHVYISVLPGLPLHLPGDEEHVASVLRGACAAVIARHGHHLRKAAVAQWEVRMRSSGAGSGAWRVVVSSPTGHESGEDNVQVYREVVSGGSLCYSSRHADTANAGALDGQPILSAYVPLEPLQQKRLAARRHKTTFAYDFPSAFDNALREIWAAHIAATAGHLSSMPAGKVVRVQELVMAKEGTFRRPGRMGPLTRPVGQNEVGIVAWQMTMRTPECPLGRQIVAIANDITYNQGAFGPKEDAVFRAATEYALQQKLPLVYLAANSGARIGLANEIKQCIQVEWINPDDPTKGFQYLYLSDADYQRLTQGTLTLKAEPVAMPSGEPRWRLSDVVGAEDGLGVECLSGSGAIASVYARAFREGFTITLVSGRTVGIGAYLARLGRRCIQRSDQPIILTGYPALNKLLGREVYTSHMQLGGPKVMGFNGVSHHVVEDDLAGVAAVLRWLSYVPAVVGGLPPHLATSDPIERSIGYKPQAGEKLDARAAVAGRPGSNQRWESGLFDQGSWVEAQAGWARSVVTGRARLGGMPVGVIAVETQTVMLNIPADPGMPDSAERLIPQAGQVWFPDSALKTAHAMEEFDREGLPLFILANWRGFSGGQRDLFEGVLQAGSLIVDALRTYRQPVTVYLAPGSELRGGAWVVIDGQINADMVEMYADPSGRGGVLEPEGIIEIKFRAPDLLEAMHRLDPEIRRLKAAGEAGMDAAVKAREAALLPVYRQVALAFAEMHDTPVRMVAKGVLRGIVPWEAARPFLATRLQRRLSEAALVQEVRAADARVSKAEAAAMMRAWMLASQPTANGHSRAGAAAKVVIGLAGADEWADDALVLQWLASSRGQSHVAQQLKALAIAAAARAAQALTASSEGRAGVLAALRETLAADPAFKEQLASLLL